MSSDRVLKKALTTFRRAMAQPLTSYEITPTITGNKHGCDDHKIWP